MEILIETLILEALVLAVKLAWDQIVEWIQVRDAEGFAQVAQAA